MRPFRPIFEFVEFVWNFFFWITFVVVILLLGCLLLDVLGGAITTHVSIDRENASPPFHSATLWIVK
jgi:hypothetical protein